MRRITTTVVLLAAVLLTMSASAASANAETTLPWWAVTSNARPTNLSGGPGKTEIQELTISGTSGNVALLEPKRLSELENGQRSVSELIAAVIPFNATAAEVQAAIETSIYPSRQVRVIQTTSKEENSRSYTITFPHQSGGLFPHVSGQPIVANGQFPAFFGKEPLSGAKEEAIVAELEPGAATEDQIVVAAENRGDANTSGPVAISDSLPAGVEAVAIEGIAGESGTKNRGDVTCTLSTLTCRFSETPKESGGCERNEQSVPCPALHPYEEIEVRIAVTVTPGAGGSVSNTATVSGGGAAHPSTASHPITAGGPEEFGFDDFQFTPENAGGTVDTQAGSHPFQVTNVVTLNSKAPDRFGNPLTVGLPKEIVGELPAGFVGNPTQFAKCTDTQFAAQAPGNPTGEITNECPAAAALGVATVSFTNTAGKVANTVTAPIFNMTPLPGEPARFAFKALGIVSAFLDAKVRTGSDYGVSVTSSNITQLVSLLGVKLTFWGVPGDRSHDSQRGWECMVGFGTCSPSASTSPPPFLVTPTSCQAPFLSTLRGESWAAEGHPAQTAKPVNYAPPGEVDGCNRLPFSPQINVTPDGTAASSPTGLNVDVHVPQNAVLNAESLAQSAVKSITVVLPAGVAINPAGGDGLQACSEALVGFTGFNGETPTFTPGLATCPDAAKIGTVRITLPILPHPAEGAVYVATQNENPFGSLIAMYIVAEDPVSGVLIKLPGETHLTATAQLIGTFKNTPQGPFEDAELHFFGGERAPLSTPARCGAYTTSAVFTPWSESEPVAASSTFNITSGPNGGPCPGPTLPFNPSFTGGTTNINAGAFSQLTTTIGRPDGQQDMQSVQLHMPAGLSGLLSGVALCPEAQANAGTCGPDSLIGETIVSAGVGSDPVSVTGGRVYITEHYAGAPFGLSIVNPVKAGPFDLEHDTSNPAQQPACDCVVVRARIDVDPSTAALTITTDPSGPHAIPHLIDGIPVQIQKVNVLINRPGFTFNPTNCNPMSITGAITSAEGAGSPIAVPFQIANCANLKFTPKFSVSTTARTSKLLGASLTTKLEEPAGALGTQANISKVKVELPVQLPSQLKTLQKACLDKVFNANPAACPPESIVGHATVHTPLLPVPLTGPAYFVSHGGEAFPSLTMVLQGYGVTVQLVGSTFIKNGITSSTFKTVPDTPFNTFELTLPQGRYAALAANLPASAKGSFCGQNLKMPTELIAQNGMAIHQNAPITDTGCSLTILSHKVNGRTLTLSVFVPSAGKIKASGMGLGSTSKTAKGPGTLTLTLHAKKHGKFKTKVKVTFTPSQGKKQAKALPLRIG
jgi:hypothetical protein